METSRSGIQNVYPGSSIWYFCIHKEHCKQFSIYVFQKKTELTKPHSQIVLIYCTTVDPKTHTSSPFLQKTYIIRTCSKKRSLYRTLVELSKFCFRMHADARVSGSTVMQQHLPNINLIFAAWLSWVVRWLAVRQFRVRISARHSIEVQLQSTYIYRVQSSVWRLPNY